MKGWFTIPPQGRKFALCFYANDPRHKYYYVGQWDHKYGWSLGSTALHGEEGIVWRPLPTPPEGFDPLPAVTWEIGD